jgi:glucose/arabinose dehydrogenase
MRASTHSLLMNEKRRSTMNTATLILTSAVVLASASAVGQVNVLPDIPTGTIAVYLDPIATGLAAPLYGISPPGDSTRMFVLEQKGQVLVFLNGVLLPTPALNIQARVSPPMTITNANDERGLLGLAFHPGFSTPASPGYRTLYTYNSEPLGTGVTYPAPNGATQGFKNVVNEWKMTTDPNVIDPLSWREVISFGKNANNHNGGTIAFGPDGYMYLGLGDGGNANDVGASHIEPGGNGQNLATPQGKMLRFDPLLPALTPASLDPVSTNGQYRVPLTNPFQAPGQVPETFAYGFRNPYRFAFDTLTGDLIMADVGQNTIEEINRVTIGGNYGWAQKEGDFLFNRVTGPGGNAGTVGARSPGVPAGLIDPIVGTLGTLEYDHGDGISITGGFVYRGTAIPELYGKYVFGDLALRVAPPRVDGRLFYADLTTGIINVFLLPQFPVVSAAGVLPNGLTVHGFGEDAAGELYAMTTNTPSSGTGGIIYKFMSCATTFQSAPLSDSMCPSGTAAFSVSASSASPLSYQWQWQPAGATNGWVNLVNGVVPGVGTVSGANTTDVGILEPMVGIAVAGGLSLAIDLRCTVTNACGSVNSAVATLTICPADMNCDDGVDISDLLLFLAAFEAGSAAADLDNGTLTGTPDGGIDISDLLFFLAHFEGGC